MQKWPLFRFSRLMDHTSWKQRNVNYPRTVWEIDLCLLRILWLIGCQKVAGHFMLQQYVDFTSLESYHGDNHFILGLTLQSNLTGMCSRVYNRGPKFKHTYRERYCYLVFMIICAAISCRFDGFKLYLVNRHTFRRARFGCVSLYPLLWFNHPSWQRRWSLTRLVGFLHRPTVFTFPRGFQRPFQKLIILWGIIARLLQPTVSRRQSFHPPSQTWRGKYK